MAVAGEEPDIILITEVIPKAQVIPIAPALLEVPGYTCFASFDLSEHNLGGKGARGICAYVRHGIQVTEVDFPGSLFREQLWLKIRLRGSDRLTVGCIYRSPSAVPHQSIEDLTKLLHMVIATDPTHLVIAGDFNLPQIDWSIAFCDAPDSHYAHKFLNAVQDCLLFQHVSCPTRYRDGCDPSLLDLVLTNEEGMVFDLEYLPGLGKSDHVILSFQVACYTTQTESGQRKLNFHRANFAELNRLLTETDWHQLLTLTVEEGFSFFKHALDRYIDQCIPLAISSKSRKNIYMNCNALRLKREKKAL